MSYRPTIKTNSAGAINDFPLDAETISGHSLGYIEINSSSGTLTQEQYNECLKDIAIIKYAPSQSSQPKYYIKKYMNTSQGVVSSMTFQLALSVSYGGENKYNLVNYYITIISNLSYSATNDSNIVYSSSGVDALLNAKQDSLTAGTGITIDSNNEISVTNPVEVMTQQEFDNATSGTTPSSDSPFLDLMYPIGSIYISSNSTSPASRFGGTWSQIKDRFILAVGDTYTTSGATGGEATHTLTVNEIPRHTHEITLRIHPNTTISDGAGPANGSSGNYYNYIATYVGGDQAHNNMPPYITKYIWERIA